ncbi:MAG: LysM peptidoglycan-binding domain-containing protein, partial [Deltaproteobacteria bacterium]|nr:LysM peptidoglycan-binding domain-containing protein [Deltaproteobacteria bacterium]
LLGMALIIFLGGCMRATMVSHERVDQELAGNRGFIAGTPPPAERAEVKESKVIEIEVDFPPVSEEKKELEPETWGNRGYLKGGSSKSEAPEEKEIETPKTGKTRLVRQKPAVTEPPRRVEKREIYEPAEEPAEKEPAVTVSSAPAEEKESAEPVIYKVKRGDSLWRLAKKFYGDPNLWKKIYDANKGVIKNPNRIYPGQTLKIPPKD